MTYSNLRPSRFAAGKKERQLLFSLDFNLKKTVWNSTFFYGEINRIEQIDRLLLWPFEKKLKANKTQNSRKKLKLKRETQNSGIFY